MPENPYYLVFDLGTTKIKAFAYSENGEILKQVSRRPKVIYPQPGWVEEDPMEFWEAVLNAGKEIMDEFGKPVAIGIATQMSSTIIWDKETGEPLYNMITWHDTRIAELAEEYSNKIKFRLFRALGKLGKGLATIIPPLKRTKTGVFLISLAKFRFGTNQPIMHVRWLMDNVEEVRRAIDQKRAAFGGMDSWILYKLTGKHISDVSNATATGMLDPFKVEWSETLMNFVGIPEHILPELVDSMGPYGNAKEFDNAPVASCVGDQKGALYSAGGVNVGTVKLTNGTGAFIDINVGRMPKPLTVKGIYPMIFIKKGDEVYYELEGFVESMGSAIDWLVSVGILESPELASKYAESVEDSAGVVFFPALAGLGAPYLEPNARGLIFGLTRATRREHITRAMLEGLAMSVAEVIDALRKASGMKIEEILADGGASKADFLLQSIADFSGVRVRRPKNLEGTSRGAFLLARGAVKGLSLREAWIPPEIEREFEPRRRSLPGWEEAKRFVLEMARR